MNNALPIQSPAPGKLPEYYQEVVRAYQSHPDPRNILFICPPDIHSHVFPLGFSQIISVARKQGFNVHLLDYTNRDHSDEILKEIIDTIAKQDIHILGVTGYSHNVQFIAQLSARAKALKPHLYVIGGGYWCRWTPEFALRHTRCDLIVTGEGDAVMERFCQLWPDLERINALPGICVQHGESIIQNGPAPFVSMEHLPGPEYDLFDYENRYVWREGNRVVTSMQTSRGCNSHCTFCTGANQSFRQYPIERIIEEIRYLKQRYGVNRIRFKEALTIINNKRCRRLLQSMIDADLGIDFEMICRVDSIDEEMIQLLKKAGCILIQFGIESADNDLLGEMKKGVTVQQIDQALSLCHQHGIHASGGFLIGMPNESIQSLTRTFFFVLTRKIYATGVTFPIPFPGTDLYEIARKELKLSEEEILMDPRFKGYGVYGYSYQECIGFLGKFRLSQRSPYVLYFYHNIISHALHVNYLFMNHRRLRGMLSLAKLFTIKIPQGLLTMFYHKIFSPAFPQEPASTIPLK